MLQRSGGRSICDTNRKNIKFEIDSDVNDNATPSCSNVGR